MHFIFFLFLSALAHAGPSLEEVAASPGWQRLLYYKTHVFGGWKSSVDGEGFFLSAEGKYDPLAELRSTIAAMERGGGTFGKLQQPIGCAFPLRKAFLEKVFKRTFPSEPCIDFEEYKKKLDPAVVSVVFATSYPSNPASMFGHSFLKVSSKRNSGKLSLLDWSLNYAAMVPEDENPFAFAFFGLAGGYQGQFALVPYYTKIEEYGYSEGRDIWEYDLALNEEEVDRLIRAVWEIETNSHFLYYFFDENCSYQLLTLLEVVRPDWDLSAYFVHMIPGESVKKLVEVPGAVTSTRMRPSLERRLQAVARALSPQEWQSFQEAKRGQGVAGLRGRALQAYLLFLQAEKKRKASEWTKDEEERFRLALQTRSIQDGPEEVSDFGGEDSRPELSHGAYQVGLGPVFRRKNEGWKKGVELSFRFAYHDLLDADPGYMAHSEVLFPNFRFRYLDKKFSLDEIELLSLVSLTPWNLVRKPIAWRAKAGYRPLLDLGCEQCRGIHSEAGAGAAFSLLPEKWTLWSMLGGEVDWAESLESVRALPWVELGTLYTFPSEGKILFETRLLKSFGRGGQWRVDHRGGLSHPFSQNWSVRLEGRASFFLQETKVRTDARILALHYF